MGGFQTETVATATLVKFAAPYNPRKMGKDEFLALRRSLRQFGCVEPIIVNRRTNHVVGGHQRVKAASAEGINTLPVVWVELDDIQERQLNLALNKISGTWDETLLAQVLTEIQTAGADLDLTGFSGDEVDRLLADVASDSTVSDTPAAQVRDAERAEGGEEPDPDQDEPPPSAPVKRAGAEMAVVEEDGDTIQPGDVPDAVWPSDNDLEVPVLLREHEATAIALPALIWGSVGRNKINRGTWMFYTSDGRFLPLWNDPSPVPNSDPIACMEVNFSIYGWTPYPEALFNIYRKRWLARYWQSKGIKILVDLYVNDKYAELNLLGVPKGWRAYSTRGYTGKDRDTSNILSRHKTAVQHAGTDQILFVVVGGGNTAQDLCRERGWVWVPDHMSRATGATPVNV